MRLQCLYTGQFALSVVFLTTVSAQRVCISHNMRIACNWWPHVPDSDNEENIYHKSNLITYSMRFHPPLRSKSCSGCSQSRWDRSHSTVRRCWPSSGAAASEADLFCTWHCPGRRAGKEWARWIGTSSPICSMLLKQDGWPVIWNS